MPGTGGQGPGKRGWDTRQSLDTAGDISPLGVQGDEPGGPGGAGPPRRPRCLPPSRSACPGHRRSAGPRRHGGGLRASSAWHRCVLCLPSSARWGRCRAAMASKMASRAKRDPRTASKAGRGLGVQASNAVSRLVDLTCQVQVKTSEHGRCYGLFVGRGDIAQGVRHRGGSLSDHGCVTGVGFGVSWAQVCDAAHRQSRQVGASGPRIAPRSR